MIRFLNGLMFIASFFLCCYCAAPAGAPGGGPIDVLPPMVKVSIPPIGSTQFNSKMVVIEFDEYIELHDNDKIVSSPILTNTYYSSYLKTLFIEIEDTLQPNVTYNINFKDGLRDFVEGNIVTDFTYVFSTSDIIDSNFIEGYVKDAFDLKAIEEANVFLYTQKFDTVPQLKPDYVAVADKDGYFSVKYIKEGCYYVFAGLDANKDYMFNVSGENLGFLDTCILAKGFPAVVNELYYDSIVYDSMLHVQKLESEENALKNAIYIYKDRDEKHFLSSVSLKNRFHIGLRFNYPIYDLDLAFLITETRQKFDSTVVELDSRRRRGADIILEEYLSKKDIAYTIFYSEDNLSAEVYFADSSIESVNLVVTKFPYIDTVETMLSQASLSRKDSIGFRISHNATTDFYYGDSLKLVSNLPLKNINMNSAIVMAIKDTDTTYITPEFNMKNNRDIDVVYPWDISTKYSFMLPKACFTDFLSRNLDTISFNLSFTPLDAYGSLHLKIHGLDSTKQYLLEETNDDRVVRTYKVSGKESFIILDHLLPRDVSFILIEDANVNGQWDNGYYKHDLQPEKRWYYPKEIKIETHWTIEEEWIIE